MTNRTCTAEGCEKPTRKRGMCEPHYRRFRESPEWATRTIRIPGYIGMHRRVDRRRGFAKDHACVDCGAPAREWSYDGTDPEAIREGRLLYSLDENRYEARCRLCHNAYDSETRARGTKCWSAKLTDADVAVIRQRISAGERQVDMAREYGLTRASIHALVTRRTWKHVA